MQITLKNVGYIKEAKVDLVGLNVIAGPNGTGKSTVGKTVFSIIKSISERNAIIKEHRTEIIKGLCSSIFYAIQNNLDIKGLTTKDPSYRDLSILMDNFNYRPFAMTLIRCLESNSFIDARNRIVKNIALVDSMETLDNKSKLSAKRLLDNLLSVFVEINDNDAITKSLQYMYQEIFREQINNINTHETSEVLFENNGSTLEYMVSNNAEILPFSERFKILNLDSPLKESIFPRVTFVETPLVLQVSECSGLPLYWSDLLSKLKIDINTANTGINKWVYDEISDILGGELIHISEKQEFYFIPKGTSNKLYVNNMASGEKLFGILQRLSKMGFLSSDHLLIFDEPENHLHPQWQVKLAEILVSLVENNISVLLTTHSSTLISALRQFAKSKDVVKKTKFYFADPENKKITNVNSLNEKGEDVIYKSFYESKKFLPEFK
ncbi:MAG: hypothetical protein E7008_03620 [Alphaproteobacteria bacterium]|nr:hypothetical protein [Alphaproteobacteria bacterium]